MSSSAIENLPPEILLQICELLQDTHPASIHSFSGTSHRVRNLAKSIIFQRVKLPIRNHDSVEETVQRLSDALGPISALNHIRTLRLCVPSDCFDPMTLHYPSNWFRSDMAPAEVIWTHDHAWTPVVDLLQRCPALSDLIHELEHQLPPCVLNALHQYRPHCRLHMRTFCARSLMGSEPDKHELALASSPCLHSIWFSYMEPEQDDPYASRSQRVIQQLLTRPAPNVREILFRRMAYHPPGSSGQQDIRLPQEKHSFNATTHLRRLVIHSRTYPGSELTMGELKSWHEHVDFSLLRTLVLGSPLDSDAYRWLMGCDLASLKCLGLESIGLPDQSDSPSARLFITSLLPLRDLTIGGTWDIHDMTAVYQRHGASLRRLRFSPAILPAIGKTALVLEEIRDQCPLLTHLAITVVRDQGSLAEMAIYKMFATFPVLKYLHVYLAARNYRLEREQGRMESYDPFDRRRSGRYGDIRRTLIDLAIDENLAKTVFPLVSPPHRTCGIKELKLIGLSYHPFDTRSITYGVSSHICRSWKVLRGVRDDRPDEMEIQEVGTDGKERPPAPKDLHHRVKRIFRRIWPGSEEGTSDWRDDWHSFLQLDDNSVTA